MAESPAWMFTKALSHRQKVMRLYKRCLKEIEAHFMPNLLNTRFEKVVMRARFDAYRDEQDPRKAALLLADGCRQLWEMRHYKPLRFSYDPLGSSYDRERESPDVVADDPQWTYPEREQFPYYFNRREQRKKEILSHWSKIEKAWDDELNAIQTKLPEPKQKSTTV